MSYLNGIQDAKIKNIIFVSEGGLGKVIASTAVVKRLKECFPEKRIIVVAGYPDVFQYNPNVYKVFRFDNPLYFYDDYITPESYVIKLEPYVEYDYWANKKHLIDVWCEQIGIGRQNAQPEMFFLDNEMEAGKIYIDKVTGEGKKKFILFQWIGGITPKDKAKESVFDAVSRMHRRSLPQNVAQKLVNKLVSRDYVVGAVQHENFPELKGAEKVFFPIRSVIALLKYSQGFIGIDSFLHHASMCFGQKGLVLWGGTNPKCLGYEAHKNLIREVCPMPMCHRPDSYMFDTNNVNGMWNCPHNAICMDYDADEIIKAYEDMMAIGEAETLVKEKNEKD
jgi:hypothetical protein